MSYQEVITIANGITSTGLIAGTEASGADAGKIVIENGGTLVNGIVREGGALSATYGAVADNLTAEAGALVELSDSAKTSGLLLQGANTNIAEGTLYYQGTAITGTVVNGTLSNLNGMYRICVGDGITVDGATLGDSVRIYARGTAVVSGGNINTGGNIGLLGESYGNDVTVGGEGVTAANYNTFDNATADNTTVNEGGNFQIRNVANNTTVNDGGTLNVSNGGVANGVTAYTGATVNVSDGAAADGVTMSGGTLKINRGGIVYNLTANPGTYFNISGGVVSGGTIIGHAGGNTQPWLQNGAFANDVTLTTDVGYSTPQNYSWLRLGNTGANVASGANILVESGAKLQINNGYAENLSATTNGGIVVYGNDTTGKGFASASRVLVYNGGSMLVYQRAAGNAIATDVLIGDGGKAYAGNADNAGTIQDVKVSGGTLIVSKYGVVKDVTVSSGGSLSMLGTAVDVTVSSGGSLSMRDGVASNVTLEYAAEATISGGTVYGLNANLSGTKLYIDGENTVISGGTFCAPGVNKAGSFILTDGATLRDVTLTTLATAGPYTNNYLWGSAGSRTGQPGYMYNVTIENFVRLQVYAGTAYDAEVVSGGVLYLNISGVAVNTVVSGVKNGTRAQLIVNAAYGGAENTWICSGGLVSATANGYLRHTVVNSGGVLSMTEAAAVADVDYNPWGGTIKNTVGATVNSQAVNEREYNIYYGKDDGRTGLISRAVDTLADFEVAAGNSAIVYSGGTINGLTVANGGDVTLKSGAVIRDVALNGRLIMETAISSGGKNYGGSAYDLTVSSGGYVWFASGSYISNLNVEDGGRVSVYHFGRIENTVISNGGWIDFRTTNIAKLDMAGGFVLDLAGTNTTNRYMVAQYFNYIPDVTVKANGEVADSTYYLCSNAGVSTAANAFKLDIGGGNVYDTNATATEFFDPLAGLNYSRTRTQIGETTNYDLKLETRITDRKLTTVDTAAAVSTAGETLNGSDRGARWTENTTYGDTVYAAQGMTTGNAWLEVDGATVDKPLYGAAANQTFDGAVNLKLTNGSIRNLAAGAAAGGTVANANFTMAGGELAGAAYAGGFGNVTGAVRAVVSGGATAEGKDFYAGALANYAKTGLSTTVGDVSLTVTDGAFGGNIYGASALKTGTLSAALTAPLHTVGDVTISLAGGTAANAEFCAFSGGYATGSYGGDANDTVYKVNSVTLDIAGGTWGTKASGGRGIFGGAFASGVKAEVGDVSISISDGTMGNVYGGGWSQKNGVSTVGDVTIAITGGTITNIFGGGTHSTSGGATEAGNVSISISGGNVTGAVYARGQLAGDEVTGAAAVTFSGANDYTCNVFGYSAVGGTTGADDQVVLTFAGYTGELSGAIGGFNSIEFNDGTAMTLAVAANEISNGSWKFDVTGRDETLADTAMLKWTGADFSGDTIALNLTGASEAGWTLVDAAATTAYDQFEVLLDGVSQGTLALGEQLADGDFAGWGFTLEDSALKFKNLA